MSFGKPDMPAQPNLKKLEEKAKSKIRRGLKDRKTVLTTPLGVTGEAPTKKPSLLGG